MSRVLRAVSAAKPETADAALDALADALLPRLRARLIAETRDADLVDVLEAVPGPRRSIMRACREGRIAGAVRVGRRWLAPRAAVDAWLRSMAPQLVRVGAADDDLEDIRRSLALPARCSARSR